MIVQILVLLLLYLYFQEVLVVLHMLYRAIQGSIAISICFYRMKVT